MTFAPTFAARGRATRSLAGVVITVVIHVAAVFLLLQLDAVRSAVSSLPIVVTLVAPEKKPDPQVLPKPVPVKPRVERPRRVQPPPKAEPPPVMTTQAEAPTPFVAPPPPPAPAVEAPVQATAPVVAALYVPPAPPAPPPPITPPSFGADYLNNPAPAYPAVSRRLREEGKVVLRVFVTEQGQPREVQMRTSSGHSRLDDAALDAVRQWRFVPARRGDKPVGAWVLVPIVFNLRS